MFFIHFNYLSWYSSQYTVASSLRLCGRFELYLRYRFRQTMVGIQPWNPYYGPPTNPILWVRSMIYHCFLEWFNHLPWLVHRMVTLLMMTIMRGHGVDCWFIHLEWVRFFLSYWHVRLAPLTIRQSTGQACWQDTLRTRAPSQSVISFGSPGHGRWHQYLRKLISVGLFASSAHSALVDSRDGWHWMLEELNPVYAVQV